MNFQINYDVQFELCVNHPEQSCLEARFKATSSIPGKNFTRVELERLETMPEFNAFVLRQMRDYLASQSNQELPETNISYRTNYIYTWHNRTGFLAHLRYVPCVDIGSIIAIIDENIARYER